MRKNMRSAFNLIMAIGMILILSGAAIMTLRYVSISAKHISDSYIQEQAEIFAQSVLEATILKIEGYNRSVNHDCLYNLTFHSSDSKFDANVTISDYYLYKGKDNNGVDTLPNCHANIISIDAGESHGYVMIEAVITSNQINAKIKGSSLVRIVKRSLQRP
jgi:hypothetical protein